MSFLDIDLNIMLSNLALMVVAYLLAFPIGWNRERQDRSAGIRTFPMVAVATCGYILIAQAVVDDSQDIFRIVQGLITGIGFIGGGAILKSGMNVYGTATAASLWNTGAIGIAVAFNRFEIAILLAILNFVTLHFSAPIKKFTDSDQTHADTHPEQDRPE